MKILTKNRIILAFILGSLSASSLIRAATDINIDSYHNGYWGGAINGNSIIAAPTNGNTNTGITFAYWDGDYVATGPDFGTPQTTTLNLGSVALPGAPIVNALFNTFYGAVGSVNATITFTNSLGDMASFSLVGSQTIRDYNANVYTNDLQGFNTNSAYGSVTAQNWWNNYAGGGGQRLDVQTFVLPTAWSGTTLASMSVYNPTTSGGTDDVLLSAVQVSSAVPEPASLRVLAFGLVGVGSGWLFARRRRAPQAD